MTDYFPPTSNLPIFDSSAFQAANNNLSAAEAAALYLKRTGVATSIASSTSFSGSVSIQGGLNMNTSNITNATAMTATTFNGALNGNASTATNITLGTGGDLLYQSSANNTAKLGIGANTYVLTSTGSIPTWTSPSVVAPTPTLANVLLAGATAGATSINMNNNNITNASLVNGLQVSSGVLAGNINIGVGNLNLTTTGNANNVAIGTFIMNALTTGDYNNCIGDRAGQDIVTGSSNNAMGANALTDLTTGNYNIAVGNRAGQKMNGNTNVFLGNQAGQNQTIGNDIICIGAAAGQNSSGNSNTYLGANSSITGGVTNSTVLGQGATTGTANTIQLGRTADNVNCPNTLSVASTSTFGNILTMNSATLANRVIRNIDYQLQDLATGNVGGQIYLNGTDLNILNNVNSGAINLYTKDGGGVSTIPLKITSTQITSTETLFLTGTTDLDRIINNVYYQFQDKNSLAITTGQIYASSASMIYDNNIYSGNHTFAVDDAVGNQVIPLTLNSSGLTVGTGLGLNMGTGSITNATAMTATTFNGALNGNASTATTATNANNVNIGLTYLGLNQVVPLINTAVAVAGNYPLSMGSGYNENILFNNTTGMLTCNGITSTLTGNASSATTASACSGNSATATTASACSGNSATATTSTNSTITNSASGTHNWLIMTSSNAGDIPLKTSTTGATYNATTNLADINIGLNAATATTASACSGNSATATTASACSGNSATATTASACSGNSATATTATNVFINGGSATPGYLLFANSTGGSDAVRGNVSLTYNTGSATLTATNITASTTLISPLIQNVASGAAGLTIRNQNGNSGNILIQNSSTDAGGADIVLNTTIAGSGVITFSPQNTLALTIKPATCEFPYCINYSNNGTTALSGVFPNNVLENSFQKEFYLVNAAAVVTITLPDPTFINAGFRITFRRSAGTATITLTTTSGGNQVVPHNSITAGVNATMLNTVWTSTFFSNGTLWYQASY